MNQSRCWANESGGGAPLSRRWIAGEVVLEPFPRSICSSSARLEGENPADRSALITHRLERSGALEEPHGIFVGHRLELLDERFLDHPCERRDRGTLEEAAKRQVDLEGGAYARNDLRREDRVAAE